MTTEFKLEAYLAKLEKALGQIPVSDRADIITEIKAHILDSVERHPDKGLSARLAALGEPETVANRYLMERGLKPGKAPRSPILKWLTIGFLGTFALLVFGITAVIWFFTPIIKVDEENNKVEILGGMISIDKTSEINIDGSLQVDDEDFQFKTSSGDAKTLKGNLEVDPKLTRLLKLNFSSGKLGLNYDQGKNLRWDCAINGRNKDIDVNAAGDTVMVDLSQLSKMACTVTIPSLLKTSLSGHNGKVSVVRPKNDITIDLANGKVDFEPAPDQAYKYDVQTVNGRVDRFTSSTAKDAVKVKISVTNGLITKN